MDNETSMKLATLECAQLNAFCAFIADHKDKHPAEIARLLMKSRPAFLFAVIMRAVEQERQWGQQQTPPLIGEEISEQEFNGIASELHTHWPK